MYRVVVLSGQFYAVEIDGVEEEVENIQEFINAGDVSHFVWRP